MVCKTSNGGGPLFPRGVKLADFELALGQNFLHFAETLFGARDERRIRELLQHGAVFLLGVDGILRIAVRLFHLLEVDVADLHLRLSGFRSVGEEGDEVLVFRFGLGKRGRATLLEPGIAHQQLGAHREFGVRIGVQQGLEVEAGHVVLAMLHGVVGLVEQLLVGLLRVDVHQGIRGQVDLFLFLIVLLGESVGG